MKTRRFFYFGKFVVFGILGLIAFTYLVMLLWNWLVPELFNGPVMTYWQTLGLLVLSKILFSGIGKGHKSHHSSRSYGDPCKDRDKWRRKFEEKMNGMKDGPKDGSKDEGEVIVTE
ncbi:MAG: hypothetical protein KAT15_19570 [Bacteroidales bacterium]|nr:hypothetical protein [Bacteroidales bacterium]